MTPNPKCHRYHCVNEHTSWIAFFVDGWAEKERVALYDFVRALTDPMPITMRSLLPDKRGGKPRRQTPST
jgi:hypothetical protein